MPGSRAGHTTTIGTTPVWTARDRVGTGESGSGAGTGQGGEAEHMPDAVGQAPASTGWRGRTSCAVSCRYPVIARDGCPFAMLRDRPAA